MTVEANAGSAAGPTLRLRAELRGETPYGAPEIDVPVRLNVNENPYGPAPQVIDDMVDALRAVAAGLNRYPDREALALRSDLAAYLGHGLTADRVWAGNGSNEVMLHVLQAFGGPGRTLVSFDPTYSMYAEYARATATRWHAGMREDDFALDAERAVDLIRHEAPAVTVLASPNNPTGTALPLDVVEAVCQASPGLVIVDEAYAEFRRPGAPSALTLLGDHPNLGVTRTLSKALGLAGVRLGCLAGSAELVDALRLVRLPYHLSTVTQAVARVALRHALETLAVVDALRAERDATVTWLREQGFRAADSDANFVAFGEFADAHATWQRLIDRGVLVRESRPTGWLRVSIGTPAEMKAFREALLVVAGQREDGTA